MRHAALLFAALQLVAAAARADATSDACVDQNTSAQARRLDGKLAAAREALEACSDARCPAIVRQDCASRLDELDRAQPTVVLEVQLPPEAGAARLTVDGRPETLDGCALRLDPGEHEIAVALSGYEPITRKIAVREGERGRREHFVFLAKAPAPPPPPPPPAPDEGIGGRKIAAFATGAAGLLGIAVGAVFGVMTSAAADRQKKDCASATSCADRGQALSDHSAAVTDGTVSTIAFAAGTALLAGGAVLFFTDTKARRVSLTPAAGARGAVLALRASF